MLKFFRFFLFVGDKIFEVRKSRKNYLISKKIFFFQQERALQIF